MNRVLVDSNVLLDVFTDDPRWHDWSAAQLDACAAEAQLCIDTIIYAEVSVGFNRIEELDDALPADTFVRLELPWEAGFLAGKAFLRYRRAKGVRTSPLPDFYIGAHAVIEDMTLLTRDARRYRSYYPKLKLICPP
jgi:predicted nucleic acid-binding protein